MSLGTDRPAERSTRTATRSGATVGLATVLGALVAPHVPGVDATAASVLVGTGLGALAALGAAVGGTARDMLHRGHDGFLLRLLGTLFALPLLALPGCALSRSQTELLGPDGQPTVRQTTVRLSVVRQGPYEATNWVYPTHGPGWAVISRLRGCDEGVSGNATLGAVGVGALAAGPVGAAAGGLAAVASEWVRDAPPPVSHASAPCAALPGAAEPEPEP